MSLTEKNDPTQKLLRSEICAVNSSCCCNRRIRSQTVLAHLHLLMFHGNSMFDRNTAHWGTTRLPKRMLHLKTSRPLHLTLNFEPQNRIPSCNPHMTAFSLQPLSTTCGCPLGLGRFILSEYCGTQCETQPQRSRLNSFDYTLSAASCVQNHPCLALRMFVLA